jgi:N-methylhydantoinase B/oxoprolinase/acetone carboxylase alpha subunit
VRDDVLDEYVSREAAERDYGVVLTGEAEDYTLAVDAAATKKLRAEIRRARKSPKGNARSGNGSKP